MSCKITLLTESGEEIRSWAVHREPTEQQKSDLVRNYPAGTQVKTSELTFTELLALARERWDQMTPAEKREMQEAQRMSYVVGEAGFGSDADEAAYAKAFREGDNETMDRLNKEARARMENAQRILRGDQ